MDKINVTDVPYDALTHGVQLKLIALGYPGIAVADGKRGWQTEGAILNFRNRNHLPLTAAIDDELIAALNAAEKIALPLVQTDATAPEIAPKVDAVKQTMWGKFVAKLSLWGSLVSAVAVGIVNKLGDAVELLSPVKGFLTEYLEGVDKLTVVMLSAASVAVVAAILMVKSRQAEEALVAGFQKGTVSPDSHEVGQ